MRATPFADTVFPDTVFSDTVETRHQVIDACLEMTHIGHFIGTWGNISVRLSEGLLLTPSRVDYDTMTPEDLVVVDWEGNRLRGKRLPTSEMQVHRLILKERPDMGAIIHSHAPWISVLACAGKNLPCIVEDMAQIIGHEVPCARYVRGGQHLKLAQAVVEALSEDTSAVMLANHGVVVGARDLAEAIVAAQILDKAAKLFVYANMLGGCNLIPEESVRAERDRYLYKYGDASDFEQDSDEKNRDEQDGDDGE